jgi:phosphotriesterase-related protein
MGRDMRRMSMLSKASGINVVASTGYYKTPYLPDEVRNKDARELAEVMINEIRDGIGDTGVKAGIIGEIGTSDVFTDDERKVFTAACYAHNETGAPIYTHTTMGRLAIEQLELLKSNDVNLEKVVIGHVDLNPDIDYYRRILDYGCYVGFDTIGKTNFQPDELRAENILRLTDLGYGDRIVMSLDISRKSYLKKYGGYGHAYLVNNFLPMLIKYGLAQRDIDRMLIDNPARIFR